MPARALSSSRAQPAVPDLDVGVGVEPVGIARADDAAGISWTLGSRLDHVGDAVGADLDDADVADADGIPQQAARGLTLGRRGCAAAMIEALELVEAHGLELLGDLGRQAGSLRLGEGALALCLPGLALLVGGRRADGARARHEGALLLGPQQVPRLELLAVGEVGHGLWQGRLRRGNGGRRHGRSQRSQRFDNCAAIMLHGNNPLDVGQPSPSPAPVSVASAARGRSQIAAKRQRPAPELGAGRRHCCVHAALGSPGPAVPYLSLGSGDFGSLANSPAAIARARYSAMHT